MNQSLKLILKGLAGVGKEFAKELPGGGLVVDGIENLLDKDNSNNIEAINKLSEGTVTAIESLAEKDIMNQVLFVQGCRELEDAFMKIKSSLKS